MSDNNNLNVAIEDTEDGFEWIDFEGKRRKFRATTQTLRLNLTDLQLCFATRLFGEEENPFEQALAAALCGNASIDDIAIEVVGDPDSRSRIISVFINAADEERMAWEMRDSQVGIIRQTALSYNPRTWETGLDSEWRLNISLSAEQMNHLVSSVRDRSVSAVTIGIESPKLYIEDRYALTGARGNWFIRPERRLTHGRVVLLDIRWAPVKLSLTEQTAIHFDNERGAPVRGLSIPAPDIPTSIDKLSEKVGKLTLYIGWLAIFVLGIAVSLIK